jgi:hypothetical protein
MLDITVALLCHAIERLPNSRIPVIDSCNDGKFQIATLSKFKGTSSQLNRICPIQFKKLIQPYAILKLQIGGINVR